MLKKLLAGLLISTIMISSFSGCGKNVDINKTTKGETESSTNIDIFEDEKENSDDAESDIDTDSEMVKMDYRTEPNTPDELAYAAYQRYLDNGNFEEHSYEFVYIDDDDIPELVIGLNLGVLALSYHDGEVIQLCYSSASFFDYNERQGYFRYGGMYREDYYAKLSNGSLEVIAYYEPILNGAEYSGENSYYIGSGDSGKEVTKDEYDSYILSLGSFSSLLDEGIKYSSMYEAYNSFKGISERQTFSEDDAWKEAYFNSYEFGDYETTKYYMVDPNKDGIPEVIMYDVDCNFIYTLDKFNGVNELGNGEIISIGNNSIYTEKGMLPQLNSTTITEYKYFEESKSWSADNQFVIELDDTYYKDLPGIVGEELKSDSQYCSYSVNGKEYNSYDEAANAFSSEYANGDIQETNSFYYESYNYDRFRQAICDYGLEIYEPLMYQVTKFEFRDGKLNIAADTAPKLEDDRLQSLDISYPIALDCKWYTMFFASPFCRKLQNKNVGCCKTVL
ncbi:MAG: hypothetical protein IJ232_05195 [Lachnospiraceae bacterium]|nr:hypothetical protein [Lachnospiraceae bacterium]